MEKKPARAIALLPIGVFLVLYLGLGIVFEYVLKIKMGFYMGGKPVSRGFGNIVYEASITMDYATQQTLRSIYGSLCDIGEFDLIVSFANPLASDDWTTTSVVLKGCIFDEDAMESQQDDTNITHEFQLHPFDIQIGNASA